MNDTNRQQDGRVRDGEKNTISDLRDVLFQTLQDLRSVKNPLDLDRARCVTEVAGKIIDAAKVEVDFVKAVGGQGSGFIPTALPKPTSTGEQTTPRPGVTVHKLR